MSGDVGRRLRALAGRRPKKNAKQLKSGRVVKRSFGGCFDVMFVIRNGNIGFSNSPFKISPYPQPIIDGKSCKRAATIICGLAGGVLGPVGSIGAAYLCNDKIGEVEEKFQAQLNSMVSDGINSIRFDVGS